MNALRHSQATKIEVEVQYLRDLLRVFVRDNGCGINPEADQKASDSHWGLRGMRERARKYRCAIRYMEQDRCGDRSARRRSG